MAPDATPGEAGVVAAIFDDAIALHQRVRALDPGPIVAAAAAIRRAFAGGGRLLAFGNGGSAADAQHLASELVGRFARERAAMAALALTADTSALTSISNDYGYDRVFARQVEGLGRPGDVALGITTSGASRNVVAALEAAKAHGLTTIALTGRDGGAAGAAADIHVNVPEASTARVQEVHRTIIHAICELIERHPGLAPGRG
jgi:D-sedoheptulose 7-phosphate isomerase